MTNYRIIKKNRNDYFYGKYQYSLLIYLTGANCLKSTVDHQKKLQVNCTYFWSRFNKLSVVQIDDLHYCCHQLNQLQNNFKVVTFNDGLSFYTSSLEDINRLMSQDFFENRCQDLYQANVVYDKKFVFLKNPKFLYRSYLSSQKLKSDCFQTLQNFTKNNSHSIRCNPRLHWSFNDKSKIYQYKYIYSTDFVDHNTELEITMLNLIVPQLTRKTFEIKAK